MTKSNLPIGESKTKVPYVKVREFFCNRDTNGTEESVHISEVSLLKGLNCMRENVLGGGECVCPC